MNMCIDNELNDALRNAYKQYIELINNIPPEKPDSTIKQLLCYNLIDSIFTQLYTSDIKFYFVNNILFKKFNTPNYRKYIFKLITSLNNCLPIFISDKNRDLPTLHTMYLNNISKFKDFKKFHNLLKKFKIKNKWDTNVFFSCGTIP